MMIQLNHLRKSFGRRIALHGLSLEVPKGQIYGLLGHNGAGKSTTIGMLLGHLSADSGEAFINGLNVADNRSRAVLRTGALFETPAFYNYLSGWRNLCVFSQYSGFTPPARMLDVIKLVGLGERIHEPVKRYSHGMRQRLALAQALLPDPELLILDEPTDGLDPEGIRQMRQLIQRLNHYHGMTILLSSHLLGEVERLCDRIGILHEGHLLFDGDWRPHATDRAYILHTLPGAAAKCLREEALAHPSDNGDDLQDDRLRIKLAAGIVAADVVAALTARRIPVHACFPEPVSLEGFYLRTLRKWKQQKQ